MNRKFGIIINPVAGRGKPLRLLSKIKQITDKSDDQFDYFKTEYAGNAGQIVSRIYSKYDAIVAFGGDGTANEVIKGVLDNGGEVPVGIIPEGTGNDLARSLEISSNLAKAIKTLTNFNIKKIDIGKINDNIFVNGVGIGYDGYANINTKKRKFLKGKLSYHFTVISSLFSWKSIEFEIKIDEKKLSPGKTFLLAIGNGKACGGGLQLNPKAIVNDGLLDICRINDVSKFKVIRNLPSLKNGTVGEIDVVDVYRGKKILIKSNQKLPIHYDGEIYTNDTKKMELSIIPQAINIIGNWKT